MKHFIIIFLMLSVSVFYLDGCQQSQSGIPHRIPVIYSSDLYHPHQDPDDHFDLALLYSLEELDVKAFIFDVTASSRDPKDFGHIALEQMSKITGKKLPPYSAGLRHRLRSPDDQAYDQPKEFQGAVELILSTLEQSDEKVVMFLVGSCIDFVVAFNRNPELLKEKVKAVYVNAGNGPKGDQTEYNVGLDLYAYVGLMNSGLPIYWCPCFTEQYRLCTPDDVAAGKAFCTYYVIPNQAELLASTRPIVQNFFAYVLNRSEEEPLGFLDKEPQPLPTTKRNMWCTAPFLHAAGREIYQTQDGHWIAVTPEKAKELGIEGSSVEVFRFEPIRFQCKMKEVDKKPWSYDITDSAFDVYGKLPVFYHVDDTEPGASVQVFRYTHPDFNQILTSAQAALLETL